MPFSSCKNGQQLARIFEGALPASPTFGSHPLAELLAVVVVALAPAAVLAPAAALDGLNSSAAAPGTKYSSCSRYLPHKEPRVGPGLLNVILSRGSYPTIHFLKSATWPTRACD